MRREGAGLALGGTATHLPRPRRRISRLPMKTPPQPSTVKSRPGATRPKLAIALRLRRWLRITALWTCIIVAFGSITIGLLTMRWQIYCASGRGPYVVIGGGALEIIAREYVPGESLYLNIDRSFPWPNITKRMLTVNWYFSANTKALQLPLLVVASAFGASALVLMRLGRAPSKPNACPQCGYDCSGVPDATCPECGRNTDARGPR